ncbi:glycerophosphodiester phosphodiesterase [Paenibacillus guangzhouensis]|uniref:glycerophosphodiester phosphodiesterase n=1 Tax=Paenibacillus guangzhouensis TaxID=1473112 RepID=UPI001266A01C|nr:glycerophosphodiester phosphodiesterase [Paenibacillus guangzhouensis]
MLNNNVRPFITAHTGSGRAPANTWASFMEACALGVDIAEIDIRVTYRQEPVLMHDHSTLLEQYSADELNRMPLRSRLGAPYMDHELVKLEDVLRIALYRGMKLNLDIKNGEAVNPTLQLVKALGAEHLTYVTGCTEGILVDTSGISLLLNAPMSMILDDKEDREKIQQFCEQASRAGYCGVNLHVEMVTKAFVDTAHVHDLFVSVYTVDDLARMQQLIDLGVDSITTMMPERLLQLKKGGQASCEAQ